MHRRLSPNSALRRLAVGEVARGDVTLLLVFLVLAVVILAVLVVGTLTLLTFRSAQDITASSQALYAADTGIEYGLYHFYWDTNGEGGPGTCTNEEDRPVAGTDARYRVGVDDFTRTGTCPPLLDAERDGLCVEAHGKVRAGTVRRRVTATVGGGGSSPALESPCAQ